MRTLSVILWLVFFTVGAYAQQETVRLSKLENRVSRLEGKIKEAGETGAVLFLFGGFCALWAQNTGRNAWLWFFLGLFFSFFTVLVLLAKNSADAARRREQERFRR